MTQKEIIVNLIFIARIREYFVTNLDLNTSKGFFLSVIKVREEIKVLLSIYKLGPVQLTQNSRHTLVKFAFDGPVIKKIDRKDAPCIN